MIANRENIRVFVNQKTGIVTRSIFDLADVNLVGIADNEVLVYDEVTGKIVPSDISTILSVGLQQVDGGIF
jgi:hypothetical protein